MGRSVRVLAAVALTAIVCLPALPIGEGAAAQQSAQPIVPAQQPTFKSGSGLIVSMFTTVTDISQRLVPDLTIDDFEILDNEKPQPIVIFDNRVQPITVIVMLDTSGSMTMTLDLLKRAAE